MATLTKRQKQMVDYLEHYIGEHGYAPTLAEVGQFFGLSSLATVHKHLRNLETKGFIKRMHNHSRALEIAGRTATAAETDESHCSDRLPPDFRLKPSKATTLSRFPTNSSAATIPSACVSKASRWSTKGFVTATTSSSKVATRPIPARPSSHWWATRPR